MIAQSSVGLQDDGGIPVHDVYPPFAGKFLAAYVGMKNLSRGRSGIPEGGREAWLAEKVSVDGKLLCGRLKRRVMDAAQRDHDVAGAQSAKKRPRNESGPNDAAVLKRMLSSVSEAVKYLGADRTRIELQKILSRVESP